ncbi:MAG: NUDIX domain-containing protein [Candidatus Saccharimonadales bacterium]
MSTSEGNGMITKVLIVAIVENANGDVLMRKKPDGSPPYNETWYIFGAELRPGMDIVETLRTHIKNQTGIETELVDRLGWDDEVKADLDGVTKQFIYLDVRSQYVSGELQLTEGIEKLEWVPKNRLAEYDLVPPSRKLFAKLGWV